MEVADDEDFVRGVEVDDRADPAGSGAEEGGGLADEWQDLLRVGHGREILCEADRLVGSALLHPPYGYLFKSSASS